MMVISVSAHVVGLIHQRLSEHRAAMRPCPRTPNYFGYGRFTRGGVCLVRPRCGVAPRRKTSGPEATDSSVGWVSHDGLADDSYGDVDVKNGPRRRRPHTVGGREVRPGARTVSITISTACSPR